MLLVETAIFYLLLGATVAVAVFLRGRGSGRIVLGLQMAAACLFWPLFVPALLAPVESEEAKREESPRAVIEKQDSLAAAIQQVETELDLALDGLDGWAEDVLNSEQHRLEELATGVEGAGRSDSANRHLLAEPSARLDSLADVAAEVASAPTKRKDSAGQHSAAVDATKPDVRRPGRHAGLGAGVSNDDSLSQIQRCTGSAGRRVGRTDRCGRSRTVRGKFLASAGTGRRANHAMA